MSIKPTFLLTALLVVHVPASACCGESDTDIDRAAQVYTVLAIAIWTQQFFRDMEPPCFTMNGQSDGKVFQLDCIKSWKKKSLIQQFSQACPNGTVALEGAPSCSYCSEFSANTPPCLSPKQKTEHAALVRRLSNKFPQHFNTTKTKQYPKTKPQNFKKPHR